MKQIIFLTVFAIATFCMPTYGQLKVYQNGNVNVKSADSTSTVALSIGSKTYANTYLVVYGGMIENVILKPHSGSHIALLNGGQIIHNDFVDFQIPIGVSLVINSGTIE